MSASLPWDSLTRASSDERRAEIANDILEMVLRADALIQDVAVKLRNEPLEVRRAVAWILEETGKRCQEIPQAILEGMSDSDSIVRTHCAKCLGWLDGPWFAPAVSALLLHLGDDFFVSTASADGLRWILTHEGIQLQRNWAAIHETLVSKLGLDENEVDELFVILQKGVESGTAKQGIQDNRQRVALAWVLRALVSEPPLMTLLAAGIGSDHEVVSVLSAEGMGAALDRLELSVLMPRLARTSRPVALALDLLAAKLISVGSTLKSKMQALNYDAATGG